jgi:hypothetical protein
MLEIIFLFFLTRKIGQIAIAKNETVWVWKLKVVLYWIGAELLFAMASIQILGDINMWALLLGCPLSGYLSYLLIERSLNNK